MKINDFNSRILCLALSGLLLVSCGGSSNGGPPPGSDTFTYVSNINASSITGYKLNSNTGALTPLTGSPFAGVDVPTGLAIAPNSHFLAAGNVNGPSVSVFRVDTDNGSINPVAGSPFPTPGGGYPLETLFHPSGKFLYAGMQVTATSDVWAFSVDASTGALSPVPGAPFQLHLAPPQRQLSLCQRGFPGHYRLLCGRHQRSTHSASRIPIHSRRDFLRL
jgi:hypothetical protein